MLRHGLRRRDVAQLLGKPLNAAGGELPRTGRVSKALALQRAGYWLELIAQLGGPRFKPHRASLLTEANRLRKRLDNRTQTEPLRAGDPVNTETQDDLARKWSLTRGADIQRFRQLALTGHL